MAKRVSVDRWLFGVTLVLVLIGLVMIFSASAVMANERFGSAYFFLLRQALWATAGLGAMLVMMNVDYRRLKHPAIVFLLLGITTLLLVAVFFLDRSHNVHRWIRLGGFSMQPSELAKPAIILFLAYFLETRVKSITEWRTLLPAAVPSLLFCTLIVLQPDLGTAIMCAGVTFAILYIAGMRMHYFLYPLLASLPLLYLLVWQVPWRKARILAWLDPFADAQGRGFHTVQSLIAVGTGGMTGLGLMEGRQKLFYLPEPQSDFIFAVAAEELGLVGSLIIVALFALFCFRGFRAALRTPDLFARFLAVGITAMIGVQAFFNISVVLALVPTKGIPLPFISSGGSSLFVALVCVGVLLNITKQID
ncbi:MAG: putative lipid II flippase FtsW [Terriglobales bacterium]